MSYDYGRSLAHLFFKKIEVLIPSASESLARHRVMDLIGCKPTDKDDKWLNGACRTHNRRVVTT